MTLGKRRRKRASFRVETSQLQARRRQPFYNRLNEILDRAKFDTYANESDASTTRLSQNRTHRREQTGGCNWSSKRNANGTM